MKLIKHAILISLFILLEGCNSHEPGNQEQTISKGNIDPQTKKSAEQGNAEAQWRLGLMYKDGEGVSKDSAKAAIWIQKSAEQGNAEAQTTLGLMYKDGEGVPKDSAKAAIWSQKSAEQGNAEGQALLGNLYRKGEGVPKDFAKAAIWLQKSAEQGNAEGQSTLGWMYKFGAGVVPKDSSKAVIWSQKSAEQGNAEGQYLLGILYRDGEGVPKDSAKAAIWIQKSAEQGLTYAQFTLGRMYKDGEGVPINYVKAVEWYKKAAIHGDDSAQYSLGEMYLEGSGVTQDAILGYAWCNIAAASDRYFAPRCRTNAEKQLAKSEVLEGQQLSLSWKNGQDLIRTLNADKTESNTLGTPSKQLTATALIVNPDGFALTNHHAVERCLEIQINNGSKAKIIATDSVNDIAILQFSEKYAAYAKFTSEPERLRQGEDIFVFGFPLDYLLSSGGNFTPGTVSALSGLGNNANQIQITAPIQPGSSGSPVLDKQGNVVAMVVMKLDDIKMAKATGQVGQNVNFAVNGQTIKTFLDTNQVPYKTGGGLFSMEKSNADIADEAKKWTVLIECWK